MKAKTAIRSLVLASLFLLVPAHADFHFMKIVEVFSGTAAAPGSLASSRETIAPASLPCAP